MGNSLIIRTVTVYAKIYYLFITIFKDLRYIEFGVFEILRDSGL